MAKLISAQQMEALLDRGELTNWSSVRINGKEWVFGEATWEQDVDGEMKRIRGAVKAEMP